MMLKGSFVRVSVCVVLVVAVLCVVCVLASCIGVSDSVCDKSSQKHTHTHRHHYTYLYMYNEVLSFSGPM